MVWYRSRKPCDSSKDHKEPQYSPYWGFLFGRVSSMKFSEFLFGTVPDTRTVHPVNQPISGTVPIQHIFSRGLAPIENLPIVRECLGYIADTINDTEACIINRRKEVLFNEYALPKFIRQPSTEFVFEELVGHKNI